MVTAMNAILISAGIYLSARIVSFIAGELTESDLKKQKEIDEEIERIYRRYNDADPLKNIDDLNRNSASIKEKTNELIGYLYFEAEKRESDFKDFMEDIKESKRKVWGTIKAQDVVHTSLRKNSLELLLRQLSESVEKCSSYIRYLQMYREDILGIHDPSKVRIFNMQLPEGFPYIGKVIWVNISQLSERYIVQEIPGISGAKVKVVDKENEIENFKNQSVVPIMVTNYKGRIFFASLEKGAFKAYELLNTHLGISALVKEIQRNYIVLTYQNELELFLPKNNLIRPDRFPPIRSLLTVYPVKWEYNLASFKQKNGKKRYPVTVSERKEDAGSSFEFRNFPICFTEDDYNIFMDYYEENNLQDYEEEFLVGPVSSNDVVLKKGSLLKLQFGDIPLFYIEVCEHADRENNLRFYFRFHHLCDAKEKTFSADDIFLPFDVTFTPYYAGTSDEMIQQYMEIDDLGDIGALIWDFFEEFRIQYQMRKDREGMGYFFKWENITNQLISVLEQGDSVLLHIDEMNVYNWNCVFMDISNKDDLSHFIDQFAKKTDMLLNREWRPEFFVKDEHDNRYVTMVVDGGERLRIVGKNASEHFTQDLETIELFASNQPYAEYQQKAALRQFRKGQVVNPVIQAACLNSSNIISSFDVERELLPFHNETLSSNPSQVKAVEQAFREKNIFLIQGPPGTGKTTVIRELIEQVLGADNESRILVVSQANVAVDNALKGLVEKYGDQTVRCGNGNKISPDMQNLRLQKRCEEYLSNLEKRKEEFEEKIYSDWFETIVSDDSQNYSPVLCELLIRNHRLIGATCVGLARRKIGLERMEFDLVIIDEAGKALPAEILIPLVRAKKVVIIGDQKQLPPVINPILYDEEKIDLEERAISENDLFCHSFFERLYDNAPESCKIMLDTQYRMPSVIGTAISQIFYNGKLKNGIGTDTKQPILFDKNLSFINFERDKKYFEKKDDLKRISNPQEANAAVALAINIRKKDSSCSIAIITPYKGQKRLISNTFIKKGKRYQLDNIYVDTIDSFQGSEADVVIFCTTRAVHPTLFFKDTRRLNVALSRAKRELIILGQLSYFYKFSKSESCLPALANYIIENGKMIVAPDCDLLKDEVLETTSKELFLSIENISLPSAFYVKEFSNTTLQEKINEYYSNGDFLEPIEVKKTSKGYQLTGNFEQFKAAMELELSECLCRVV